MKDIIEEFKEEFEKHIDAMPQLVSKKVQKEIMIAFCEAQLSKALKAQREEMVKTIELHTERYIINRPTGYKALVVSEDMYMDILNIEINKL